VGGYKSQKAFQGMRREVIRLIQVAIMPNKM
jgi:hypothetical protein